MDPGDSGSSSPSLDGLPGSPGMHRNPSPPPSEGEESAEGDAIGNTVYSKHWLFSTLTRLIQVVSDQEGGSGAGDSEAQLDLDEEVESEICKVWDMSMDQDVARFLQEFKAADILLGVIGKSKSPRLTEICVGVLGNIACFPETCQSISGNEDLGEVLLLLLGDSDPPTLLETSRLLLTCLSHPSVAPCWVERIRQQKSVCENLCFVMSSSTNVDLLVKVGEVVDKLFDLDEELMRSWIRGARGSAAPSPGHPTADGEPANDTPALDIAPSVLEAAKQLRSDSPDGLEVYMHILQLLTTVDEGIQAIVLSVEVGEEAWSLLCDVVCSDLCQPDDPPIVIHEQKTLLAPILAVLSAMFVCQAQHDYSKMDKNLPLIGSLIRVLQYLGECQQRETERREPGSEEEAGDNHLKILKDTCCEFLANILTELPKDTVSELVQRGYLSEETCSTAVQSLLSLYSTATRHFLAVLSEVDEKLADGLLKDFPSLRP